MFSPFLNASTNLDVEETLQGADCFDQAEAGFQAAKGSHKEKYEVFEAVYES